MEGEKVAGKGLPSGSIVVGVDEAREKAGGMQVVGSDMGSGEHLVGGIGSIKKVMERSETTHGRAGEYFKEFYLEFVNPHGHESKGIVAEVSKGVGRKARNEVSVNDKIGEGKELT